MLRAKYYRTLLSPKGNFGTLLLWSLRSSYLNEIRKISGIIASKFDRNAVYKVSVLFFSQSDEQKDGPR
jgi:hypothetical protein